MAALRRARARRPRDDPPRVPDGDSQAPGSRLRRPAAGGGDDAVDREAWKSQLLADGKLSRRTINKLLTNLHGVFERARRVWGLERNPVADVERLRERYDAGDYDWLRPDEVYALVRAAEEAPIEKRVAEQDAAIFLTAAFAGLRLGEVLGLRWRDVDFTRSVLRVTQQWNDLGEVSATKGGRVRAVPMVPKVAERLARLSQRGFFTTEDDPVFVGIARWHKEIEEEGEPQEVEAITEYVDRSGHQATARTMATTETPTTAPANGASDGSTSSPVRNAEGIAKPTAMKCLP